MVVRIPEGPSPDGPELASVVLVHLPARRETGPPGCDEALQYVSRSAPTSASRATSRENGRPLDARAWGKGTHDISATDLSLVAKRSGGPGRHVPTDLLQLLIGLALARPQRLKGLRKGYSHSCQPHLVVG